MTDPLALVLRSEELIEEMAREVVVALVPVAFTKVKFCKVEEPVRRRLAKVVSPPVAVTVPVKLAADEMV